MSKHFSVRNAAEELGVCQHTILQFIRSGELRAVNVARPGAKKPRWRIPQAALDLFLLVRTATPPPPTGRRRKRPPDVIEFYK
jgi:excisionase family DNA binding protein